MTPRLTQFIQALKEEFGYAGGTIDKLAQRFFSGLEGRCPACGREPAAIAQHSLSPMLVEALAKFRAAGFHYGHRNLREGLPPYAIHLRGDMGKDTPFPLSFDQVANWSKLRTHGFVAHADKENSRSGYWLLTPRGVDFLDGAIQVHRVALSQDGHKVGEEGPLVTVDDFKGDAKYDWLVRDTSWRPERAKVAVKQTALL